MKFLGSLSLVLLIAASVGFGLTWNALTSSMQFGALHIGTWTAWPKSGTAFADPYTRALFARTAELPLGLGDGLAFIARKDDRGRRLSGQCVITVRGKTPQARYWTLTVNTTDGRVIANPADRYAISSYSLIRDSEGVATLVISPTVHAGHWIPSGNVEDIVLILRLYDTPLGIGTRSGKETPMPSVHQECGG